MRFVTSFRSRILAIVLLVGVVPLALIGLWLAGAAARSGEALLRERLEQTLDDSARRIGSGWVKQRSALLDLADATSVRVALAMPDSSPPPAEVIAWLARPDAPAASLVLRGASGGLRWAAVGAESARGPAVLLHVPLYDGLVGPRLGELVAELEPTALLGGGSPGVPGMVLGAFEPASSNPLLPLPFDPALLADARFVLGGEEWLTARRGLSDPDVLLVAAAPLTPFTRPFQTAARQGAILLAAVALLGLLAALLLTSRLTRSLERLADAAQAVSRGELDRRVDTSSADEIGLVAGAFNHMTESLRGTLAELADRRALAAVGEFAASLAHEIRNPLTSIQLDLQMVEERLPPADEATRTIQARALAEIRRLDRTVAGTLRAARSGRIDAEAVDLHAVLRAAARAAAAAVAAAGSRLDLPADDSPPIHVAGDPAALEQVFVNLLLNAAAAGRPGGRIYACVQRAATFVDVVIEDDGRGIPPEALSRVFEPLFTTRPDGAGLGLPIARRLTEAHGGTLKLASQPGHGTVATVRLPLPSL